MAEEKILVIDDDELMRDTMCTALQGSSYICGQADTAGKALQMLESDSRWDVILSDMVMPGMGGMRLLETVHANYPDIPVVMVTGVHDISVALEAIRKGAYDYVLKPFQREQLLRVVERSLEMRRLRLENIAYRTKLESLVQARTEALRDALHDLERSYEMTLEALGNALDLRDAETEGHSKRVTAFTMAIAKSMGLPDDQQRSIYRGAFLHDIGKMAIPDAILRKPGRLTPEEQAVMREHCLLGYQMLRKIPFLKDAADIVYSHQERYDGSGYPRGLRDGQIPLGARIFAIADTFDAIISDRPYRAAQSISAARREIQRYDGSQFDPEIVKVFLSIPEEFWQKLRAQIDGDPGPRKPTPRRLLSIG